jgi:hypothetical protein
VSTPISRQRKRGWEARLGKLADAAQTAAEDVLVGIHEAVEDGLSQADIAYMVGGISPSGVRAKALKGQAIKKARATIRPVKGE